jgi:hypothetical protein
MLEEEQVLQFGHIHSSPLSPAHSQNQKKKKKSILTGDRLKNNPS